MSILTRHPTRAIQFTLFGLLGISGASAAHAQSQLWVTQFGSSQTEYAVALAPDAQGGVMVTGRTIGNLGGPFANGWLDAFLARYDGDGHQLWLKQFGASGHDRGRGLAADGAGGVFVTGETDGNLGGTNAGYLDTFVARFDENGNQVWIRQFGSTEDDNVLAAATDDAGGVIVGGITRGNLSSGNAGGRDAFLARYDSNGNQVWYRQVVRGHFGGIHALAPDGAGGVVAAGQMKSSNFGPYLGSLIAFVARYDSNGDLLWISELGSIEWDSAHEVASDGAGGAFVAGMTYGNVGGPSSGKTDAFLARFDHEGNPRWIHQFGTIEDDGAGALLPDGVGGLIIGGSTSGNLGGPQAGGGDAFIARYDGDGNRIWMQQFGSSDKDWVSALATDSSGSVIATGTTDGSLGGPNAGARDAFLGRYTTGTCYADCDQSSGIGLLDMADFLCFQSSFVNSETYACDCDTSTGTGVCDIFDFLCFQNSFVAGCS